MGENSKNSNAAPEDFFKGGGEMGDKIRAFDWANSPLGAIDGWQQSLKTAVRLMLDSRFSMFVWWGADLTYLYNDAYAPTLGAKHPAALGKSARDVWREIWADVGPQAETVIERGEASWNEEMLLFLERKGFAEETYHTFSYSPITDDVGEIGGLFCAVNEETAKVISRRRLQSLRDLGERTLEESQTIEDACRAARETLGENPFDIPFALAYLLDADGKTARLMEVLRVEKDSAVAPSVLEIKTELDIWRFGDVLNEGGGRLMPEIDKKFAGKISAGAWDDDFTRQAYVVPLAKAGIQEFPAGFLVAGLSPRLEFDKEYRDFIELAAGHIATAIANARTLEEERKRAASLAELDRAKTEFFSNVSHEFRTPLTLMLGNLEDVLQNGDAPHERGKIETAHRNSLRLLKLVNTLLDFSRIEANRQQADFAPTDLAKYTAELASNFRSAIEKAGIKLTVDCSPLSQEISIDREMWEKIVLNLISNAFKFTFAGEIKVSLTETRENAVLQISDTGTGISAENLPHVFERFHRVAGAKSRTHEGTGIGLALVKELVKLHDGAISATSEIDEGTTFTISVPKNRKGEAEKRRNGEKAAQASNAWQSYLLDSETDKATESNYISPSPFLPFAPSGSILLADDNADMREYVQRLLEQNGYRVSAVPNGAAALELLTESKPDLILSDVMMPFLDGFGLLEKVREAEETREIPVILLSARAGEEAKVEGLEAGADDYLIKPFSAKELIARVDANLKLARLRGESARQERELRRVAETAHHRFENVLKSISDGLLMLDKNWIYTYFSERGAEFIGMNPEQLVGKCVWDLFPHAQDTKFYEMYHRAVESGQPAHFEEYYPAPLDQWLECHCYPSDEGLSVYFHDVTQRKRTEANLVFLADLAECFARLTSAEEILRVCGEKIARFLNLSACLFAEINEAQDEVKISNAWIAAGGLELTGVYRLSDYVTEEFQQAARAGEIIVARDTQTDSRVDGRAYAAYDIQSFVSVPFRRAGEWKYLFTVNDSSPRDWREDEIELVREFTSRIFPRLERARAEDALRTSEERFKTLVGAASSLIWTTDANGFVIEDSPAWRNFTGQTFEQFQGWGWANAIHPDDREETEKVWREATSTKTIYQVEYRLKHRSGEYRLTEVKGVPIYDESGAVREWVGMNTDITESKAAEQAVRESEEKFRDLANSISQFAWMADALGHIFWYNERWFEYTGTTLETMQGWGWQAVHAPEEVERVTEKFKRHIAAGEIWEDTFPLKSKTGEYRWFLSRALPIRNERGEVVRWFGTNTDVEEIRQARLQAENANRLKDEFLATVSHELRTPLNAILGWASMLQSGKATGEIRQRADETIYRSAKSQAQLIEDLLDVSRIITGKMRLEARPVRLAALVESAIHTLRPAADAKSIRLDANLECEPCIVNGDSQRLQQIVWNLISNAVKFTPEGGAVSVNLETDDARIRLIVSDTGKGIEPEFLPFMFERFSQEDGSTTRRHGGLGLGLAIVRHLVELHGGKISAASAGANSGSTFTVELPLISPVVQAEKSSDGKAKNLRESLSDGFSTEETGAPRQLTDVRVLLVDDELDTLELLDAALSAEGANVRVASSAADAFEIFEDWKPDVLVSDIAMPDEDGYSLLKRMRALPIAEGGAIPAIAMTAYVRVEDRMRVLKSGFQMYVPKPAEPFELTTAIVNLVDKKKS